ncbi:hypothetical protein RHPLAN_53570 [Rhodoplanes sp. Z2-YC6860]|nr:hypothetical protein RHPLAN_53570 [Rhodoplanes sp. Z2-YC6860]
MEKFMSRLYKTTGLLGLMIAVSLCAPRQAEAINAELAKKCREKSMAAYPLMTTGGKQTNAKEREVYFRNCLNNNGNVDR